MMKRFFTLLLAASCLTVVGQVPDYVPADGLIGWWPLDGDALDHGPSSIDGVIYGATSGIDRWGDPTGAMRFQNVGDRIELGEISSNIGAPNSALTISCWFKGEAYPSSGPSSGQLVSAYYGLGQRQIRLEVVHAISNGPGDHLKYYWRCPEENDEPVSGDEFSTSNWNHYVMIVDPSNSEIRVMLNGLVVEDLSATYSPGNDYSGTETRTWMFGSYHPQINNFPHQFFGEIDEVGIWNRVVTEEEVSVLYNATSPNAGCTDVDACNFDDEAVLDDGSCISCDFIATFCGVGTIWDSATQTCIGDGSGDINLDGCVQLNDLLDLLSAYGDCGAEESPWQCGDPLEYQGYDYETVQIGEQCWFAENLRAESYRNGESLGSTLMAWLSSTEEGQTVIYGADSEISCQDFSPEIPVCDSLETTFLEFGLLYNNHAISDIRGVCPLNWHVSTDEDWMILESFLGIPEEELAETGFRGSNQGQIIKTTYGWKGGGSGSDAVGFHGKPAGGFSPEVPNFNNAGSDANWWAPSDVNPLMRRNLNDYTSGIRRVDIIENAGISIRCIKDTE